MIRFLVWCVLLLPILCLEASDLTFFEEKIHPLLKEHCYKCHSAEAEKLKGGLHVDSREGLMIGGDSGPSIVPGKPGESLLVRAVEYKDEKMQMPPKQKLSDEQVQWIREWIAMGVPDSRTNKLQTASSGIDYVSARKQWAFRKVEDPALPKVTENGWVQNGVDNFILQKIEHAGLRPNAQADKRTLLRRVTFDLIGLPPTPEELADFMKDESPKAFERVVERLLASPLYGERWGRHWLDVVRYADSLDSRGSGSEGDISEAYRYRDWVVKVFNEDLPYDQFILKQFAGDILQPGNPEEVDRDGLIATSLFAIGEWGTGDADKEKMMTDIVDDQIDVTGRAFLGLTIACARCHDHKFDPISAQDYYGLAGIFFSSHIIANPGAKTAGTPVMRVPLAPPAELERRKDREARIKAITGELDELKDKSVETVIARSLPRTLNYLAAARAYKEEMDAGARLDLESYARHLDVEPWVFERWLSVLGFGELPLLTRVSKDIHGKSGLHAFSGPSDTPSATVNTSRSTVDFVTIKMPPESFAVHPSPKAGVAVAFKAPADGTYRLSGSGADADPNCGDGIEWVVNVRGPGMLRKIAGAVMESGRKEEFTGNLEIKLNRGELLEIAILPRGDYGCDTTVVEARIRGDREDWVLATDVIGAVAKGNFNNPSGVWSFYDLGPGSGIRQAAEGTALVEWFEAVGKRDKSSAWAAAEKLQARITVLAAERASGKTVEEIAKGESGKLFQVLVNPRSELWGALRENGIFRSADQAEAIQKLESELNSLRSIPTPAFEVAHAMKEGGVPDSPHAGIKDTRIHIRGRYDRLGEAVPRAFPRVVAGDVQKPIEQGSGRLELARWITSPENPLTARVMVNRLWQHHFGDALARTPNNFGKLGEPPTHPELLDWLSKRFIEAGWSMKAMHRLMVLSATYQQSSQAAHELLEKDPENRLFARMNRKRVEAEVLRDSVLAVNGSLDPALGGKNIRDFNSRRRTLYQTTIRSVRSDYRALFDAADPTAIVEKREVSTVAPQALFMLNHPFMVAETRRLAERVLDASPRSDAARVTQLYLWLFAREPRAEELELAARALDQLFKTTTAPFAEKEMSAWQGYCQILLASNEFSYID